jgi:hypothetical protein
MCDPATRIPTYASLSSVSDVDCVSLETNELDTQSLTIGGTAYTATSFDTFLQKTQYQSASGPPAQTTFVGNVVVPVITSNGGFLTTNILNCDTIGSTTCTKPITFQGPITTPNIITLNDQSTFGATVASFLQPGLLATNSVRLFLGATNTTNNGATFEYNHLADNSTTNNLIMKVVGGSSQVRISGTTTTISGPLKVQSAPVLPRVISVGETFASTLTSNPFNFSPDARRVEIHFINVVRKNPNNFEALLQFGVQPSTWDDNIGNYQGSNLSNDSALSVYWSVFPGCPIIDNWPTGGTFGDFLWSGRIVVSYLGVVGTLHRWTINGQLSTPNVVNISGTNFGPYTNWITGNYTSETTTNINMLRLTCQDATNTFQSGYATITSE